jgi:hypothetical protein
MADHGASVREVLEPLDPPLEIGAAYWCTGALLYRQPDGKQDRANDQAHAMKLVASTIVAACAVWITVPHTVVVKNKSTTFAKNVLSSSPMTPNRMPAADYIGPPLSANLALLRQRTGRLFRPQPL